MATVRRRVLLAIDASRQAEHAFDWYVKSFHTPENEVILLHVLEIDVGKLTKGEMETAANTIQEAMTKEQANAKKLETKYNEKITQRGIRGSVKSEFGRKPGEVICNVAEREAVTMIVVGTRGLGGIRRTIMGSVSDYVVHHAHCPVVVCRE